MGQKRLADELNIPIALGEHVYNKYAFRDYFHQGAIEYCQVDVTRVGGITEWLDVASLSKCYDHSDVPACRRNGLNPPPFGCRHTGSFYARVLLNH